MWTDIPFDYAANAVGHSMTNRRLPWSTPSTSPNPGGVLKQSSIPNAADLYLVWDAHFSLWTIGGGWQQLKGWPEFIEEGGPHFDTTFRHSDITHVGNGNRARVARKGPNALLADGHVEQRMNFLREGLSDDNFNIAAR